MWFYLLIVLLIAGVVTLLWRQNVARQRIEREREARRARTDELLARVLLGEDASQGRKTTGGRAPSLAKPVAPPIDRMVKPAGGGQQMDIDLLLGDEPESVADRTRRQLARPTNFATDLGNSSGGGRTTMISSPSTLSLQDGQLDVSLDALVVAWFEARGYAARQAPGEAQPLSLLLTHRDDSSRSYAFYFERGRLTAQRAASLLDKARGLGMSKLLVAAEHGADPAVGSSRLRDVQVMDWVAIDREMKKIDFRVAAKIIAIARANRGMPAAN